MVQENKKNVLKTKQELGMELPVTDCGAADHFLGVDIRRHHGQFYQKQSKGISQLLKEVNMENCRGIGSPLDPSIDYSEKQEQPAANDFPYKQLIGSLLYFCLLYTSPSPRDA